MISDFNFNDDFVILNLITRFLNDLLSEALVEDGEDDLQPLVAKVLHPLQAVVG